MENNKLLLDLHKVINTLETNNFHKEANEIHTIFMKTAQSYQTLKPDQVEYAKEMLKNVPELPKSIKDLATPVARSMVSDKSMFDKMTAPKPAEIKKDYIWYSNQILDKKIKFKDLPQSMSMDEKSKIYNYVKKYNDAGKTTNQDNITKWNRFIGVEKDPNQKPISVYNPGMDPRATKIDPNFINKYRKNY
jgi:hypothetical protein